MRFIFQLLPSNPLIPQMEVTNNPFFKVTNKTPKWVTGKNLVDYYSLVILLLFTRLVLLTFRPKKLRPWGFRWETEIAFGWVRGPRLISGKNPTETQVTTHPAKFGRRRWMEYDFQIGKWVILGFQIFIFRGNKWWMPSLYGTRLVEAKALHEDGPLPVLSGALTPQKFGYFTTVTHLFSAIYRGCHVTYNWWLWEQRACAIVWLLEIISSFGTGLQWHLSMEAFQHQEGTTKKKMVPSGKIT